MTSCCIYRGSDCWQSLVPEKQWTIHCLWLLSSTVSVFVFWIFKYFYCIVSCLLAAVYFILFILVRIIILTRPVALLFQLIICMFVVCYTVRHHLGQFWS